eukprot:GHVS01061062.1.p1 GENE.GHVS01061062.1~~GHVS01061062.1.p1  ORF type:complete len:684 (-),score=96.14 GHVS01061062.1:114-2165(-)
MNDKDMYVTVGEDGLECRSQEAKQWMGARATAEVLKGKYMFEVDILGKGLVRVGCATPIAKLALGTDDKSFGYGGTGKKSWNNTFENYGGTFRDGDVVGCLIDRDEQTVSFCLNGKTLGQAFSIPPYLHGQALRPGVCGKEFHVRCRFSGLVHPVSNFKAVGELALSDTPKGMSLVMDTADKSSRPLLALILEPTRDLAQQTYNCLCQFGRYLDAPSVRTGLFVGGIDERGQQLLLQQGVDICVGTLSKVVDYVRKGKLDLSALKFLVLDEADDLMKNDDRKDIPMLKNMVPRKTGRVQTLFFSATLHSADVKKAVDQITHMPTWVDLKGHPTIPDTVHFVLYEVDPRQDLPFATTTSVSVTTDGVHAVGSNNEELRMSERIKQMKPQILVKLADALKMESCLVFCRTNVDCDNLEAFLNKLGGGRGFAGKIESGKENPYSCVVLAGMRMQEERERNLQHFKQGDVRFLVCTDVAARGIDIKELPFLVMMTLPDDPDQFFHRVGRVGRADRMGLAVCISALHHQEKVWYHKCANRGRGCTNTNLVEKGGCTIWYDEPSYQKAIESRIGKPVPHMDRDTFTVKGILDQTSSGTSQSKAETKADEEQIGGRRRVALQKEQNAGSAAEAVSSERAGSMVIYGKARDDENTKSVSRHISEISATVDDLQKLERHVQREFIETTFVVS